MTVRLALAIALASSLGLPLTGCLVLDAPHGYHDHAGTSGPWRVAAASAVPGPLGSPVGPPCSGREVVARQVRRERHVHALVQQGRDEAASHVVRPKLRGPSLPAPLLAHP
jgi:hypothetical protein